MDGQTKNQAITDIRKCIKNLDPNNPFTTLISMICNAISGIKKEYPLDIFSNINGRTLTEEEHIYQTNKLSAWLAYRSLIEFLSTDKYPGDEVSDILKNLWRAKDEILPNLKEQINKIIEDLTEKDLCFSWMKISK